MAKKNLFHLKSYGGSCTTKLVDIFGRRFFYGNAGGTLPSKLKHTRNPYIEVEDGERVRVLYIYRNPYDVVLCYERKNFFKVLSPCQYLEGDVEGIEKFMPFTIEEFLDNKVDFFKVEEHFMNWWNYKDRKYDIAFVKYEALEKKEVWDFICDWLERPEKKNNFRFKKGVSDYTQRSEKVQRQLKEMFGEFKIFRDNLRDIEIMKSNKIMYERPAEYSFVFQMIALLGPTSLLDIGTGRTALPALISNCGITDIVATDSDGNQRDKNKYWNIVDDNILNSKLDRQFDMVTCISVLEHISDFDKAIEGMTAKLKKGGALVLSFPYCEIKYIPNNYNLPNAGYGKGSGILCQSFSRKQIDHWRTKYGLSFFSQEYWKIFSGPHWTVGHKLPKHIKVTARDVHQLSCVCFIKG